MPSPSRRIPSYRHYIPKNLAVVRIDGKDEYLGKYNSAESWEKYHRRIAEWLNNGRREADPKLAKTIQIHWLGERLNLIDVDRHALTLAGKVTIEFGLRSPGKILDAPPQRPERLAFDSFNAEDPDQGHYTGAVAYMSA